MSKVNLGDFFSFFTYLKFIDPHTAIKLDKQYSETCWWEGYENLSILDMLSYSSISLQGIVSISYQQFDNNANVYTGEKKCAKAKRVVMTSPIPLLSRVTFTPALHPLKKFYCDTAQTGHLSKFIVTYDKVLSLLEHYSYICIKQLVIKYLNSTNHWNSPLHVPASYGRIGVQR